MTKFMAENGVITDVFESGPAPEGAIETDAFVLPGWLYSEGTITRPEPELAPIEDDTLDRWSAILMSARAAIAGTSDPAKLAEYADKAANAQGVIDGTAPAEIVAEAQAEADSLGLDGAGAAAQLWLDKAAALRTARTALNVLDREQREAIARRSSVGGFAEALDLARQALDALLAELAG